MNFNFAFSFYKVILWPLCLMHHRLTINLLDYFAPVVTFLTFVLLVFLISFFFINFWLITDKDDLTVFEKFGARHFGIRLGPHSLAQIRERMPMTGQRKFGKSPAEGTICQRDTPQREQTQKKWQNGKEGNDKLEEIEMKEKGGEKNTE